MQQLNVPKLEGNISIENEQDLQSYSTTPTSFASRSRGKSARSMKCSINSTSTIHLRHTTKSLSISHHYLHHIPNHHPSSPPSQNQFFQPPPPLPHLDTMDLKSPLANHLQLAPWPSHYRATPPPKYHGNIDPRKFLMCYETAIASAGVDEATLAKSFIISLEDDAVNWYSSFPSKCIYS
jgi:hypothetical protein